MEGKSIRKVSYNGLHPENWIENRDYLLARKKRNKNSHIFIDTEDIGRSGRDMQKDYENCGYVIEEGKFVDIGEIDYIDEEEER